MYCVTGNLPVLYTTCWSDISPIRSYHIGVRFCLLPYLDSYKVITSWNVLFQVPTKALLFRLLDVLSVEPPWSEGELCMECGAKFGLATRKHHCRHCGRLLCNRCSDKDVPIIKFSLNKPVRVCQTCFDVLTLGAATIS